MNYVGVEFGLWTVEFGLAFARIASSRSSSGSVPAPAMPEADFRVSPAPTLFDHRDQGQADSPSSGAVRCTRAPSSRDRVAGPIGLDTFRGSSHGRSQHGAATCCLSSRIRYKRRNPESRIDELKPPGPLDN